MKFLFLSFSIIFVTLGYAEKRWNPSLGYNEIVDEAKGGSPYFQGLLGIYLRAGEAGSIVNIDVSKQWSNVSYQKSSLWFL